LDYPICATCGVQHTTAAVGCKICEDERQYVGWDGQRWTTLPAMAEAGYRNRIEELEPGLWGIGTEPKFAIGQRSLLVQTETGNILWDPMSYVDQSTVDRLNNLGGIHAISASHPHFYGAVVEWSRAFDSASIFLPTADRGWVCREDPAYVLYKDEIEPLPGVRLLRCGGHFEGSAVLHWQSAAGQGVLATGDTIQVVLDRRFTSFMRSYPNLIPLDPSAIRAILAALEPYPYERLYGGWWGRNILTDASMRVKVSAERYIERMSGRSGQSD